LQEKLLGRPPTFSENFAHIHCARNEDGLSPIEAAIVEVSQIEESDNTYDSDLMNPTKEKSTPIYDFSSVHFANSKAEDVFVSFFSFDLYRNITQNG
jgi:hypothetical protein